MSDVWYPGRPPLKTPEIIQGVSGYARALARCSDEATSEYLEEAERWHDDVLSVLKEEAHDCLSTDPDINGMIEALPQTLHAAKACVGQREWELLDGLAAQIEALSWALRGALDAIEERPDGHPSPEEDDGPRCGPDDKPDAGQEDEAVSQEGLGKAES